MFFDSHCHTEFSADSSLRADEALAQAKKLGLGLVFTEHMDIGFPGELDFTFDPAAYWQAYEPLRGDELSLGIEIGLTAEAGAANLRVTKAVPFDMVLGSLHLLRGEDIYYLSLYKTLDKGELYREYLQALAKMTRENPYIDALAHYDYICRYAPYADPAMSYDEFATEIEAVLTAALETDTVLELNTRRLETAAVYQEMLAVYRRYRKLGGRYITVGSDGHSASAVGKNFAAAKELAVAVGLTPVTFRERRPVILR
ncbi:MAG: histidinol-phosphatase HisJ family protein [Selenomonadaceae bacterium]|nr:histidinol-phosphatase HisJ family protein [Selenomonadaceae bacterium]